MAIAAIGFTAMNTIAAASAAISIAATIQSTIAAQKQAEAQEKAQDAANTAAKLNTVASYKDLDAEQADIQRTAVEANINNQKQVAEAKGQATARRAATGAGDISTLITDINKTGGENIGVITDNRDQQMASIRTRGEALTQQGLSAQDTTPIQQPSWLSAGLSIASSAASGYGGATATGGV